MSLADLHCHILPGIDDGAESIEAAKELLKSSAEQGVMEIACTPHYYPERISFENFVQKRNRAAEKILPIAEELGIRVRIGAEISCTPILASLPLEQLAYSGTNYLLLELFTMYQPMDVSGLIRRIRNAGFTPILAHIERYPYIAEDPTLLYQWIKLGALAQVNAGWIQKDKHAVKRIKQYYKWNLVHLLASDCHSMKERPQNLAAGYKLLPTEIAEAFQKNAEVIFSGEKLKTAEAVKPVKKLGRWK